MGILKHLLFWPITGPNFLARYSLEKIEDVVREELTDDQSVKEDLMQLQMELEVGDIDDEEYVRREAELMLRLREVRRWREEFGMGTSGGPVQVVRDDQADAGAGSVDGDPAYDAPDDDPEAADGRNRGVASPDGASIEFNLDWEE